MRGWRLHSVNFCIILLKVWWWLGGLKLISIRNFFSPVHVTLSINPLPSHMWGSPPYNHNSKNDILTPTKRIRTRVVLHISCPILMSIFSKTTGDIS